MKNYLKIQSSGEIEINAFTLVGASSKRDDATKIGYYGSGLKYSIAAMLRNERPFKVFAGEKEIVFSTKKSTFRDEDYDVICVDEKETSLTVGMGGKDWDLPFAPIREIYSNALDEDEDALLIQETELKGDAGKTTFYIYMDESVKHFYQNKNQYFCGSNPDVMFSNDEGTIYQKTSSDGVRLFRKGILSYHHEQTQSIFDYNSNHFDINESRVISSLYIASRQVSRILKTCTNEIVIKQLMEHLAGADKGKFEHEIEFDIADKFSENWLNVCRDIKFVPTTLLLFLEPNDYAGRVIMPSSLLTPLSRQFPELDILGLTSKKDISFVPVSQPSQILVDKVIEAVSILNKTRYVYRLIDPVISYVKFMSHETLGQAYEGNILLSIKLDTFDVSAIAKIIIEENEHNKTGFRDKTRAFQDHLFDLYYDQLISKPYVHIDESDENPLIYPFQPESGHF